MSVGPGQISIKIKEENGKLRGYFSEYFREESFAIRTVEPSKRLSFLWVRAEGEWNGQRTVVWISRASFLKNASSFRRMGIEKAAQIASRFFSLEDANQKLEEVGLAPLSSEFNTLSAKEKRIILATLNSLVVERDERGRIRDAQTDFSQKIPWMRRVHLSRDALYILLNKLKKKDPLVGTGNFGKVKTCFRFHGGEIQKIARSTSREVSVRSDILQIVRDLSSERIARIYTWEHFFGKKPDPKTGRKGKSAIYMDLYETDLEKKMKGPLTSEQRREILLGLLEGMTALHGAGIVHQDLKPENILLKGNKTFIGDLGQACLRGEVDRGVGTREFVAPEIFDDAAADPSYDIWSLGMIIGLLHLDHSARKKFYNIAIRWNTPTGSPDLSKHLAHYLKDKLKDSPISPLLEKMLQEDPKARITATEARAIS